MKTRIFYMVMALVLTVALAVPVLSPTPALAADKDYDFSNLTIRTYHDAFYCDVDSMSASGPDVNSKWEAGSHYKDIAASDDSRWQTSDPSTGDYVFMWFDMIIAETPASISNIDLTFEGYGENTGNFEIWAYNSTAPAWDQIGTSMSITTEDTMTRSITANFDDYVDGSGLLRWGVYFTNSSKYILIDYAAAVVTGSSATYNFAFPSAYYCDVDDMSASGPALTYYQWEANGEEYQRIAASDDSRWQTSNPGSGDEVFMWFDMIIGETPAAITNIDLTFEGYCEGSGDSNFKIWAYNSTAPAWDQIGTSMSITTGSDDTMTRSITANFDDYVDGSGLLRWGVYCTRSDERIQIDYAEAVVTGSSTTYGFCYSSAYYLDEDDAPPLSWGYYDRQAYGTEYIAIAASDNSRWQTPDPDKYDYVFLWFGMVITETPGDITNIDLVFEGYGEKATGTFEIWAYNNNTTAWQQITPSQEITTGADDTMTRSITTNCDHYINGCGLLRWGVFYNETTSSGNGYWVKTDYVKAVVTVPGPAIHITKTGLPNPVAAGQTIQYTYNVTRSLGDITSVDVTDNTPGCTTPAYVSGDANTNDILEDGEVWTYTCDYVTTLADWLAGSVENEATANGTAPGAVPVQDKDTETVTVNSPENPELPPSCGLDVVLVLDSSDSIENLSVVKNTAKAFVSALLPATPSLIGVVEFDTNVVPTSLNLTNVVVDINTRIDGIGHVVATEYTNWEAALTEATKMLENTSPYDQDRPDAENPDLIIIITNGSPTTSDSGPPHLAAAIAAANAAKLSTSDLPIRIVAAGVNPPISAGELDNLKAISGPKVSPPDVDTDTDVITDDDPAVDPDYYSDLADDLAALADVCLGTIIVEKVTEPEGGTGFDFSGDLGAFSLNDGQNQEFLDQDTGSYNVTETVPDCWELTDITIDDPDAESSSIGAIATIDLDPGETVTCTFTNTRLEPVMTIDKDVVGGGPVGVAPGGKVQYTIDVTNSGTCAATNVSIFDTLPSWFTFKITDSIVETGLTTPRYNDDSPVLSDTDLLWGYWDIDSGGSVTITFTADVSLAIEPGTYQNTAYADGDNFTQIDDEGDVAGAPYGGDEDTPLGQDPEVDENVLVAEEPPPVVTGVPTLSQWGMIAMGILFAAFLIWTVRRRWATSADRS